MSFVRTVLGDIPPEDLGITYHHEHIISAPPRRTTGGDPDLILDSVDRIAQEVAAFQALGGRSICDASAIDYGRDIAGVVAVARRTGAHLIATAGFNKGLYFEPWIEGAALDSLTERIRREVREGIDGTPHRAGMVKFGSSYGHISPVEEKCARAVCRAQRALGAPLFTHAEAGTMVLEQLDLLREEGVELEQVCIGHLDRNPDLWLCRQVAKTGAFISLDQWSKVKYGPDSVRMDLLIALVKRGLQKQILISGDLARRSYLRAYGGGPGYGYILGRVIPRLRDQLREEDLPPAQIEQVVADLLVNNPRQFFTFRGRADD